MEFWNSPESIYKGFRRDYERARHIPADIDTRIIIFSDHHRGDRGRSDYFQRCEKTYNAALGYYLERGYHLILLGDVEEFWEFHPRRVMDSYPLTYDLESQFYARAGLTRVRGNHDSLWKDKELVKRLLWKRFPGIEIADAVNLDFRTTDGAVTLFLAHGHQGTFLNDTLDWFSMFWLRIMNARVMRSAKARYQTPATSYSLREEHEAMMFECADRLNQELAAKTLLITGHTHHPIFMSRRRLERIEENAKYLAEKDTPKSRKRLARLRSRFEYIKADFGLDPALMQRRSLYFNTGCCSFGDGSITGIEIAKGKIRLIRWQDEHTHAERMVIGSERLEDV